MAAIMIGLMFLSTLVSIQAWDLKCGLDRFEFQGNENDFPGWTAEQIKFGSCALGDTFGLKATYKDCGVNVQANGDVLDIKANLLSDPITSVITRKVPVEQRVGCTFNTKTLASSTTAVETLLGRIGGLVTKQGKPMKFTLKHVGAENQVSGDEPLQVPVGEDVEVEVSGPHLEEFDVFATISDCFATPSADPNDAVYYNLVNKMCIQDKDVSIRRNGRGQILKFKSFAFTERSTEMVYLHCDVYACTSLKSCGKCVKDWRSISKAWIKQWNERVRVAMVFEPDTYQTLDRSNLRCQANGIKFQASEEDFPQWKASDIYIGTCPLNDDFSLSVTYAECGLSVRERRHQLLMQTFITGAPTTDVIRRKRPIKYMLRCGYDRFARISSPQISPILADASHANTYTNKPDMFLNILDARGHITERATLQVELRDTVVAVIGGKNVGSLKMKLYAINCFVTATADPNGPLRYDLLKDSCPLDETFYSEQFGAGQKIFFDAFAFTDAESSEMFLHCDVTACLDNQNCGVCNAGEVARRKRAAVFHHDASVVGQYFVLTN